MAILWIVAISFGMLACVEHLGEILEINHFTMGLVIIAVGTSIPDAISSRQQSGRIRIAKWMLDSMPT